MFSKIVFVAAFLLLLESSSAFHGHFFHGKPFYGKKTKQMSSSAKMMLPDYSLLNAVVEAKPDGYEYGAVNAPGWVLPVGAVLVILTAAIPILLSPGEKALDQQRIDEETVNNQFGKRRKDL